MLKDAFVWQVNAIEWKVYCGWIGTDAETGEHYEAVVSAGMENYAESAENVIEAHRKALALARVLIHMKQEGCTLDEMDAMMKALATTGTLDQGPFDGEPYDQWTSG